MLAACVTLVTLTKQGTFASMISAVTDSCN